MIKFFRKIRQKLLSKGKTGMYLKYAVGEIILVVIGILIALQVNNANEQRKENEFEIKILNEITNNLQIDLEEIREDIDLMDDLNKACSNIKNYILIHDKPNDSLSYYSSILRVTPHFSPITSAYDLLKSRNIGIIKNDSLRNEISFLYGMLYPYYKTYEDERSRFHAIHSEPKLLEYYSMHFDKEQNLHYYGQFFAIDQEDFTKLKRDVKFTKLLSAISFENKTTQDRAKRVENSIIELIENISSAGLDSTISIKLTMLDLTLTKNIAVIIYLIY
jgi:Zn-finger protein